MHTDWNFLKKILLFERKWIKWYLIMKPVGEGWWRDCGRPGPAPALATCRHLLVVTWPGEWQAVFPRDQWPGSPVASIQTNGGGRNQSWHVSTGKRQQRGVCDQPRPASTAATVQLTSMVCGILQSDELCWHYPNCTGVWCYPYLPAFLRYTIQNINEIFFFKDSIPGGSVCLITINVQCSKHHRW